MKELLFETFGFVILPTNYNLFTSQDKNWKLPIHEVFYKITNNTYDYNKDQYFCKTKKELKLLSIYCLSKYRSSSCYSLINAIIDYINKKNLENIKDGSEGFVNFKNNYKNREEFINALVELGIDGWISPIETYSEYLECCIFRPENSILDCRLIKPDENINTSFNEKEVDEDSYEINLITNKGNYLDNLESNYIMLEGKLKISKL